MSLKVSFKHNMKTPDGLVLLKFIEKYWGHNVILHGFNVSTDNNKVIVSPGLALLLYPLTIIENDNSITIETQDLEDGNYVILLQLEEVDASINLYAIKNSKLPVIDDSVILGFMHKLSNSITISNKFQNTNVNTSTFSRITSGNQIPDNTFDKSKGFRVLDFYLHTESNTLYICKKNDINNAQWIAIQGQGGSGTIITEVDGGDSTTIF